MMTGIIPGKKKRPRWILLTGTLFLSAVILLFMRNFAGERVDPLTVEERAWLKAHPVIRFAPDPDFPPVEYFDKNGEYTGITKDYLTFIENKLGIRFEIVRLRNWNEIISKAKSRQIDIFAATRTPQRSEYLLFTKPFLDLPAAIIAREKAKAPLDLGRLGGMKVSVVSGYATHDFLAGTYPKLNLDLVPDVRTGLRKVSFGISDVFVENLATATYYIEKEGIANLRVAGESGYAYSMAFCTRKDWPELNRILEKGLAQINADEQKAIYKKWIPLEHGSLFASRKFQAAVLAAFGVAVLIIASIVTWNRTLAGEVCRRTRELEKELAERKRAEESLRESEEKFRVLADTSPAGIIVYQGERVVYVNAAVTRFLGYTEQECLQMRFWDWVHDDFKAVVKERGLARQQGEKAPSRYECRHVTKNGEDKWIFVSGGFIEYRGKPAGIVTCFDITERKRMEEELERARDDLEKRVEERTAELAETVNKLLLSQFCIDKAAIGIYQTTFEGDILSANDFACRSLGYTADELCALKVTDIDPAITHEKTLEIKWMLDHTGFATHESVHRRKDGSTFPVEITTNQLEFNGKPYSFSFVKDITGRKRANAELKLTQFLVDKASIGIHRVSEDGNIIYVNEFFCRSLGYTHEELCSMTIFDIDPDFSLEKLREHRRITRDAGSRTLESMHRRKDGSIFPVEVSVTYLEYQDNEICVSFARDITDRKRAEEALRQANLVVENSPVVLFRWKGDDEWPVELVSRNIMQFGYTPEEFLSGSITYSAIILPDDLERVTREVHDSCNDGADQFRLEYRIMTKGGDVRWVNEHTNVERDAAGGVKNFEGIIIDVTERRKAEEQLILQKMQLRELNSTLEDRVREEVAKNREKDIMLIQQNRQAALGEMLDHIAHQWKQPLNSISLIIQDLGETASNGELTEENLEEAVGKTMALLEHMAQTIDVFRNFYRPEKERVVFRLKDAVDRALSFMSPALRFHRIGVAVDADPDLHAIGYPGEYAQVLLNILTNARDTFKERKVEKPELKIDAFAENGKAVVAITDNAGGIPETIIGKIFDLYFTTRESKDGTGIGLYMSRNIIEKNMGGTLSASNVDNGAQFRIELVMA